MMSSAGQSGSRRWRGAVSGWPVWELPPWLLVFVLAVMAAFGAAIVATLALTSFHDYDANNIELFAILLGCDVVTVELTRRSGEPGGGLIKETHAVWELPIALLLPPLYGLIAPIVRLALTQWRVRQTLAYRRVFTASALGLTYAAVSVAFHALAPPVTGFFASPTARVEIWVLTALACGVLRSVLNKVLVMTAVKGADPAVSIRAELFTREALFGDLAELSIGVLVAYVATASALLVLLALPCVTLLQRSLRHGQLVNDARIDGLTGMLNKKTWHREAAIRVTRATRPHAWRVKGRAGAQVPGGDFAETSGDSSDPAERRSDSTLVALLVVDIDRFKWVQDTCGGHQVGDAVLEAIADTIRAQLRESDLCGRYGGDEFTILLPDTSADEALAVAHRLCQAVSELTITSALSGIDLAGPRVTVSVGVAALDRDHVDLDELVRAADGAMYQAKSAGRNTVRLVAV
jgi:diguanylate cyclase (GGDEF)-like protein